ncbi:MAG TPA: TIGR01458 family HAD-type hydrolase [Cellvibrionaceae bacterium]
MQNLVLLDLDGTLYVDNQALPGAAHTLTSLRRHYRLAFLTNTTTQNAASIIDKLLKMGIEVTVEELFTPVQASLQYLTAWEQNHSRKARVWPLVDEALRNDFSHCIFDETTPDVVILGDIGERWNLGLINQLFRCLNQGSELVALHKNRYWQTAQGLKADIGFFVAGLEYVSGQKAKIMGKPSAEFFRQALVRFNCSADESLMVGDDIDSDVGGAQAAGIRGVLVQTGKYRAHYCEQALIDPWAVITDITALPHLLERTQN